MALSAELSSRSLNTTCFSSRQQTYLGPRGPKRSFFVRAGTVKPDATILVAGATGGVGQLLAAKLLERGYKVSAIPTSITSALNQEEPFLQPSSSCYITNNYQQVRAMSRSKEKAAQLLGSAPNLEIVIGDILQPSTLPAAVEGVDAICAATGTTAFPSARWKDGNNPESVDYKGMKNLIDAAKHNNKNLQRFVLTTSAGVERQDEFPWKILNLFGVLKYKRMGEIELQQSGIPYTLVRPGRLTDGPYTSYDLNTLLGGIAGSRQDVELSVKENLMGEASRIVVAEAMLQALGLEVAENKAFSVSSKEGDGPGTDAGKWKELFEQTVLLAKG